jgi:hypothetical protein
MSIVVEVAVTVGVSLHYYPSLFYDLTATSFPGLELV